MEIKIKESQKIEELILIDPKSGCNWVADLIGNCDAVEDYDDDGMAIMSQEDYDWWHNYVAEYQLADNRYNDLLNDLDDERYDDLIQAHEEMSAEINDYPSALNSLCDEYEVYN